MQLYRKEMGCFRWIYSSLNCPFNVPGRLLTFMLCILLCTEIHVFSGRGRDLTVVSVMCR